MRIAIIGASKDRDKYSNKAVRAYVSGHHVVFPVNPNEREIEGLKCYSSVLDIPMDVEYASIYLPYEIGMKVADDIQKKGIKNVFLNPGADNPELLDKFNALGINALRTCSIRHIGVNPKEIQ